MVVSSGDGGFPLVVALVVVSIFVVVCSARLVAGGGSVAIFLSLYVIIRLTLSWLLWSLLVLLSLLLMLWFCYL